jgi:hypothetical protein
MTCKAFNGRVVAEWLRDVSVHAHEGTWPGGNRKFGRWLKQEIDAGHRAMPSDSRLLPQRLALILGRPRFLGILPVIEVLPRCVFQLRTGLCRYFGLTERAGRILWSGCTAEAGPQHALKYDGRLFCAASICRGLLKKQMLSAKQGFCF